MVFTTIVENKEYDLFLQSDNAIGIIETPEIIKYKSLYDKIVNDNKPEFELLAKIEEVIVQLRCKESIQPKLSIVKGYVYARSLFYRMGKEIKDIRIIAGRADNLGTNLDVLLAEKDFISRTIKKLEIAMEKELLINLSLIEELEEEYENNLPKMLDGQYGRIGDYQSYNEFH